MEIILGLIIILTLLGWISYIQGKGMYDDIKYISEYLLEKEK